MKNKVKEFWNTHKTKIEIGGVILLGTATGIYAVKCWKDLRAATQELNATHENFLTKLLYSDVIQGEGVVWDQLKEIFSNLEMGSEEIWMLETDSTGRKKLLSHISDSPVVEQLEF